MAYRLFFLRLIDSIQLNDVLANVLIWTVGGLMTHRLASRVWRFKTSIRITTIHSSLLSTSDPVICPNSTLVTPLLVHPILTISAVIQ